jgi:hypothetical protein
MSDHTPGPWMADTVDGYTTINVNNRGQTGQTITHMFDRHAEFKNASANAILIAAAPDLFEAARNTISYYEATQPGARCLIDQLNPCNDIKHWGGGIGCPLCSARSALARAAL